VRELRIREVVLKIDTWDSVIEVHLEYPRQNGNKRVRICLSDVRAADYIEIEYDFDRDGWRIIKPNQDTIELGEEIPQEEEVAFIGNKELVH
jgi:hypothetical protein